MWPCWTLPQPAWPASIPAQDLRCKDATGHHQGYAWSPGLAVGCLLCHFLLFLQLEIGCDIVCLGTTSRDQKKKSICGHKRLIPTNKQKTVKLVVGVCHVILTRVLGHQVQQSLPPRFNQVRAPRGGAFFKFQNCYQ